MERRIWKSDASLSQAHFSIVLPDPSFEIRNEFMHALISFSGTDSADVVVDWQGISLQD
jgi:hypothetical protein